MEHMLASLLFILFLVVFISILNERTVKISNDVALVLFSFLFAGMLKIFEVTGLLDFQGTVVSSIENMNFQEFLMDGILCFMLFSGASGVNF
ncbi:MAG: hypothetical protein J5721_04140, partial [Lachnospiraceae bacterium]|nr:hypothetical protein [Lachnospiraceae bacterium]